MQTLSVPPLAGGGLVLGYRCSSRCRHCLYGSGPHRRDGEASDLAALDQVLDLLAARAPGARMHIGGGEPFLYLDQLRHAIEGLRDRDLALEYVETNAAWVKDQPHAEQVLADLATRGLGCVLVSLSPFHAEHVPLARTHALIAAARQVLPGGAFVWIPDFAADVAPAGGARLDLEALLAQRGDRYARGLCARYGLVLGGRAGRFAARHGELHRWRELLRNAPCRSRLLDTSHFHVDAEARYVPGLCAGIALPLEEVPGEIDLDRYPLLRALANDGLGGLIAHARARGFVPADGYSSACDLCGHARLALWAVRDELPELGPPGFYDPRSIPA